MAALFPEIVRGPALGPWHAAPRGDGTFVVVREGIGVAMLSGSYATEEEAMCEADELNGVLRSSFFVPRSENEAPITKHQARL